MPNLFLSPSVQEYNPYINGLGSEEYYMNLVADAMEPYLISCGISFTRNNPDDTLRQAIALSNAGNYDFHLALHSNAAPPALAGQLQGCDIYYYATSTRGARAAEIFAEISSPAPRTGCRSIPSEPAPGCGRSAGCCR